MEPFIGQIQLFPYHFAPKGWAFCEGQLLQITEYTVLFSLIGDTFGGDARNTFALPDLKAKNLDANLRYCIALEGIYPPRG